MEEEYRYAIIALGPMDNYNTSREKSFTMIELIVVITLILLFTGFSIGYYNQYTEQKKLESGGRRVSTILDLTRAKTISGDSSLCGTLDATTAKVESYSFDVLDPDEYALQPKCVVGIPTPIYYKTETNIIFTTTPLSIPFFSVSGGATCSYVYLKNTKLSDAIACRYVKITSTGLVSDDSCSACDACPNTCP